MIESALRFTEQLTKPLAPFASNLELVCGDRKFFFHFQYPDKPPASSSRRAFVSRFQTWSAFSLEPKLAAKLQIAAFCGREGTLPVGRFRDLSRRASLFGSHALIGVACASLRA